MDIDPTPIFLPDEKGKPKAVGDENVGRRQDSPHTQRVKEIAPLQSDD
jgi:hypothetical protein